MYSHAVDVIIRILISRIRIIILMIMRFRRYQNVCTGVQTCYAMMKWSCSAAYTLSAV